MIALADPWALFLLPLPLLVHRFMPPRREQVPALRFPFFRRIVAAAGTEARAGAVVQARTRLQMVAAILCWILVALALARPEHLGAPVTIEKSARDMVLAIDISGSMDTRDFATPAGEKIQRHAAVRDVVRRFVERRKDDRMGLIVFGSRAYLQAPLTEDLATITELLDRTEVAMAGPHTALGDAIGLAIRTFESSDVPERVLILLSDGSDTASRMDPVNAAAIAAARGVTIYTIGVGDPAATGENKLDEATLRDIAARTGGQYFFAGDQQALEGIYARIDTLAPRVTDNRSWRPHESLAWLPMAMAALIALAVTSGLHLSARRRPA